MENKSFGGVAGTDEAPTLINAVNILYSEEADVENELENMGGGIDKKKTADPIDVENSDGHSNEEQGNTLSMSWFSNND